MKVAFVLKYFLPGKTAGTEVYVAALGQHLVELGVEVVIIKPGIGREKQNEYYYENIRVVEYPESEVVDKDLQTGKRSPAGLEKFRNLLIKERPEIVHFHEFSGSNGITIEHLKVAHALAIPVFTTLHLVGYVCQTGMLLYKDKKACSGVIETMKCSVCTLHKKGFGFGTAEVLSTIGYWFQKNNVDISFLPSKVAGILSYSIYTNNHLKLLQEIFSISKKVFVLSDWFKELLLVNNLPKKKFVLLPKASPSYYKVERKKDKEKKVYEPVRFVYLGRISRIKGLHIILEALKTLQPSRWSLDIYGQVSEEDYFLWCDKMVKEIKGNIIWRGSVEPNNVIKTLSQYDAMIFPTIIQEMVGLVVQEAFVAGVPVIGSEVKGISEQVKHEIDGLLFKTGNSKSLKNLLQQVITDKSILPRLAANITTTKPFSEVSIQTAAVYQSILQSKKTAAPNYK